MAIMKIIFPTVVSRSGSDVYFQLLAGGLKEYNIASAPVHLSHRHEVFPFLSAAQRQIIASGDIIHTAIEHGTLVFIPGRPLVLSALHNVFDPAYRPYTGPLQRLFHRLIVHPRQARALRLASAVICISEATRRNYAAIYPEFAEKLQVIYPGVDTQYFTPGENGKSAAKAPEGHLFMTAGKSIYRILFVGHMTRRKGADLLPRIMDRLGPDYSLTCVGQRNTATRRITTLSGAQILVRQAVSTDDLLQLYRQCNLLLFPSRLEGFGYAVVEAMACAKPVVATNGSSLPELLDDERGGYLCPMDEVGAFADAVRQICSSPAMAAEMGKYNRRQVEARFSLNRMLAQHVAVYEHVLNISPVGRS
jgi:glycosyltransferase involved in cell wall biosynthesis